MNFGEKLASRMKQYGAVCVGIDPHPALLQAWDLPDSAEGVRAFALRVVEAVGERAAALKPQSAFFERHGSAGIAALEDTLAACRDVGVPSILDVKRGDIGSTMDGYAEAYLRGSLEADAITISPYLGAGSLKKTAYRFAEAGKGVFMLALTSNPEGASVQHKGGAADSVAGDIVQAAQTWNDELALGAVGPVGLVVGATLGQAAANLGINLGDFSGIFLSPGIGAQGAGPRELSDVFGAAKTRALASASRSILSGGPSAEGLANALDSLLNFMQKEID